MPVLRNIGKLATCASAGTQSDIHVIPNAALAWDADRISWAGADADLPYEFHELEAEDAGGCLVMPGLVDCHTHLAFAGWRADEFDARIHGMSYLDIARSGGGILKTVRQTREATEDQLYVRSLGFIEQMMRLGVTTVECKSGYGLNVEDELKQLRVYRKLAGQQPVRIISTFLGAHAIPPEFREKREAYIRLLIDEVIPRVAGEKLATFCDAFVEETAFHADEARLVLEAGKRFGMRPKVHADQLSTCGGAELAAEVGAISADHLEHVSSEGIRLLAKAGVTAVSLPFASLYLHQTPLAARKLMRSNVSVAVATDFNPGSAPSYHLPLAMMLACTLQQMTPAEVLKGATIIAARAIGRQDEIGSLEPGKKADFILADADDVNQWLYQFRPNAVTRTVIDGRNVT